LAALAKQQNENDYELILKEANRENGHLQFERNAGISALSSFQTEKAWHDISKRIEYGVESQETRVASINSYATLASELNDKNKKKEAKEKLLKIVSEGENFNHNYPVRKAAVLGLVTLKAEDVISHLESMRHLFSNQDQPWLTRRINSLKNAKKDDNENLKKELQTLKEKVSQLEKKLDK